MLHPLLKNSLAASNTCIQCGCILCLHPFTIIILGTVNTSDATNDSASSTCNNMYTSNTCTNCCLNTIIAGPGNTLDSGVAAAYNACKQCLCLQYLYAVWLHIWRHKFCFNAIIAGIGNTLHAGNDAMTNTCKQGCTKLWLRL